MGCGLHQKPVEARHAEKAQTDNQQAGNRTASERNRQCFIESRARRLGCAHVRSHRDVHADVPGKPGQQCADRKSAGGARTDRPPDDHEQHHADDAYGRVLPVEICLRAGLNRGSNFAHSLVAGRLGQNPADRPGAIRERDDRADKREHKCR